MTDHCQFIIARMPSMNIAVAPAHWAEARTEVCTRDVDQRFAKRRSPSLVANQWRKNVAFFQKQTACDADCFLAFTDVNAARNLTSAVKTNELLLERTRQQHPAKRFEKTLVGSRGFVRSSFAQRCGRALFSF